MSQGCGRLRECSSAQVLECSSARVLECQVLECQVLECRVLECQVLECQVLEWSNGFLWISLMSVWPARAANFFPFDINQNDLPTDNC
jgi:hypothetical protein